MLFPLASIFNISIDELLEYDEAKANAEIDKILAEYQHLRISGKIEECSALIAKARKKYPHDYRIMNKYMWDKVGGSTVNNPEALLNSRDELSKMCDCILEGCTQDYLRTEAIDMKAKLLHASGNTEAALEVLSQLPNWYAPMAKEQLFDKDSPEFSYWNRKNCYGLMDVMSMKLARIFCFDSALALDEKINRVEAVADAFAKISQNKNFEFFCIGEQSVYAVLANMLSINDASIDDIIRIREKQFNSMKKMTALAQTDKILYEQIKSTYKTDNIISWQLNLLLSPDNAHCAKLLKNCKYSAMLNKWKNNI